MNTRLLFSLLCLTPTLCFGALSTTTSYFLNVEALTNVTARSAVRGLTGAFTNGITAGASTFNGPGNVITITNTAASDAGLVINQFTGATNSAISVNTAGASQFKLYGEAANTLALRNGTGAQWMNIYNTFTDASNYERLSMGVTANIAFLGFYASGTGASRPMRIGGNNSSSIAFYTAGTLRWTVDGSGGLVGGYVLGTQLVTAKTADYPVTTADSKTVFTNEGTTAIRNNTLPGAAAGLTYTFIIQDADGVTITAAAGDTIRIAGSVSAAAGNITATTIGNTVTLVAINATEWIAVSHEGTWTVN